MTKAKVYFSDMRTRYGGLSLPQKLGKLIEAAGIGDIDFQNKFAAIKIHFGEPGNLSFLRPNYAKVVVDTVAAQGGRPFLTDCNTLYVGRRKHALEHITAAYENGFSPFSTGCHIIIADGLKGTDEAYVTVPGGELVQEAKIGKALMDADIVISLNHFKGHEATGFGGAIKNIGMGGGSRAGKMEMHHDGKPHISERKCIGCGACVRICAHGAPIIENKKAHIDLDKCVGCGRCIGACPMDAVKPPADGSSMEALNKKMAEYAWAILHGRPHFHISLIVDVSPYCLGYDKAFGSWHYGAAISHNDGKTTYDSGKGENKSTSLSLYGTWLGDRGHYTDIVLKQGRLSNEYDNYAAAGHTHGDYDAWGTSLSGEYGMKVGLDNGWYVTPQAQLTLMRIGGEDYTTNNGIKVSQDTLSSCVGRLGFEMGKSISDKGSIYAKASLLHEFAGNADTYLSLNGISNSYSQDIGGTWYEAGLGFNFKTTDNSYVYADVVKTFGDDIKTPWQWNVGARWSF